MPVKGTDTIGIKYLIYFIAAGHNIFGSGYFFVLSLWSSKPLLSILIHPNKEVGVGGSLLCCFKTRTRVIKMPSEKYPVHAFGLVSGTNCGSSL